MLYDRLNHAVLLLILPLSVSAALALIGGTIATVLAESVNSKEIFDQIIDKTPHLSHVFIINNMTVDIVSYKSALE